MRSVAIVGYGMPFDHGTLTREGLGGSETAQLCLAHELAKLGLVVHQVCNLPGNAGGWYRAPDGVTYTSFTAIDSVPAVDLLIVCRRFDLLQYCKFKYKHAVLWIHDFADQHTVAPLAGFINEVWAVSNWQSFQWKETLAPSPLPPFWVTRNGIPRVDVKINGSSRRKDTLVFASRPERGLWPLIRPGGIMSRLPDWKLYVAGYDDRPERYADFYARIDAEMAKSNIVPMGSLNAARVRELISVASAYVMPTPYAETSCILARECIERGTPMIVTPQRYSGALLETLGECAVLGSSAEYDSEQFIQDFVQQIEFVNEKHPTVEARMMLRTDLYWDAVARSMYGRALDAGVFQR